MTNIVPPTRTRGPYRRRAPGVTIMRHRISMRANDDLYAHWQRACRNAKVPQPSLLKALLENWDRRHELVVASNSKAKRQEARAVALEKFAREVLEMAPRGRRFSVGHKPDLMWTKGKLDDLSRARDWEYSWRAQEVLDEIVRLQAEDGETPPAPPLPRMPDILATPLHASAIAKVDDLRAEGGRTA